MAVRAEGYGVRRGKLVVYTPCPNYDRMDLWNRGGQSLITKVSIVYPTRVVSAVISAGEALVPGRFCERSATAQAIELSRLSVMGNKTKSWCTVWWLGHSWADVPKGAIRITGMVTRLITGLITWNGRHQARTMPTLIVSGSRPGGGLEGLCPMRFGVRTTHAQS